MNANPCETNFEPLLDPNEAATLLGVHKMTLLRLVRRANSLLSESANYGDSGFATLMNGSLLRS